jgi:transposase
VLTDDQIKWIVKQKIEGKLKNEEITAVQGISIKRMNQIYSLYKKNGSLSVLKKAGRHKASVTEEVIIEAYGQFKSCASYLEHIIKQKYGLKINHMKINYVLKQEGLAMSNKWILRFPSLALL